MFTRSTISRAAWLALATFASAGARAQDAQQEVQVIEITGSRIVRANLIGPTPVLTLDATSFGNLGLNNFADLATQLPQFGASFGQSRTQSTFSGVGATGLNSINLRNLGPVRSLVLINGRRVPGGRSTSTAVDFNTLPTANIERIEVITGGASAIYGADAVAGVVNIITRRRFEGVEIGLNYGVTQDGDDRSPGAHLMLGGKLGSKGHALLTLEVQNQGRVRCADRYLCAEDFSWLSPNAQLRGPAAYSGVGLGGRFFVGGSSFTRRNGSFTDANGGPIPFDVTIDGYNRSADRDIAIPTKRTMVAAEMEYELGAGTKAFAEFNYGKAAIASQFEGHPFQSQMSTSMYGKLQATIPVNNPFIPPALLAAVNAYNANPANANSQINALTWWQRFNDAGGPRGATNDRETMRAVFGFKGDLGVLGAAGRDWRWELSHVHGRTSVNLNSEGLVSTANLYNGLRVEADPANPGQYRCIDAAARAQGCVPINPFADYTPQMQQALRVGSMANGRSVLDDTVGFVAGSPFELPAGSVRTVLGFERRSFSGFLDFDAVINNGLATGNQSSDIDRAKTTTSELFTELLIPILADKPFARTVNFEAAFRHSSADTSGAGTKSYNTWKLGGDWEPVDGLRLRAMRARSARAPIPGDLSGVSTTAGVVNDPCTATRRNANPTRAANCAADGIPADYAPPLVVEQGVSGLSGGNPNLSPEKGTTLTFGVVWQPAQLKGFSISVDRFDIRIRDAITTVSRQIAANKCYDTANRVLCSVVTRGGNPLLPGANYVLTAVDENLQNVAEYHIAGIDLDTRYALKLDRWGRLDLSLVGTYYDKADLVRLAGDAPIALLGQAGGSTSDQGWIRFTATGSATWHWNQWSANWNLRHIGSANMGEGTTALGFPRVGAHTYHNVRVGHAFQNGAEVYLGITNLFDKKPPFFASGFSGTQALDTIPAFYDVFGRSYFAGMKMKF